MNRLQTVVVAALGAVLLGSSPVRADVLLTPYAGFSRIYEENKGTFGVTFGFGGLIGLEFDAARIQLGLEEDLSFLDFDAHATTLMGNMVVRFPAGPIQPYGSAGVGLVRVAADVDVPILGERISVDAQDLGWNLGGGLYVLPSPNFGIRADFRHFRTGDVTFDDLIDVVGGLDDLPLPNFNFWRTTFGVTLKF
jgi:opacity protein-like surface antigen